MEIKLNINSRRVLDFRDEDDLFSWVRQFTSAYVLIHELDNEYHLSIDRDEFNKLFPKFAY